jgi:hypothetical protein
MFQVDIMMFPRDYAVTNNGFVYLLTFINSSTRFVFAYPMKDRTHKTITRLFRYFLEEVKQMGGNVTSIVSDEEFYKNKEFRELLKSNGIMFFHERSADDNHYSLGIVNRFHRTLKLMLDKYYISNRNTRWIDYIDNLIHNYNHRFHRTLGKSPAEMTRHDIAVLNNRLRKENMLGDIHLNKINIGDKVRTWFVKKQGAGRFDKGEPRWSETIYRVIRKRPYIVGIIDDEIDEIYDNIINDDDKDLIWKMPYDLQKVVRYINMSDDTWVSYVVNYIPLFLSIITVSGGSAGLYRYRNWLKKKLKLCLNVEDDLEKCTSAGVSSINLREPKRISQVVYNESNDSIESVAAKYIMNKTRRRNSN